MENQNKNYDLKESQEVTTNVASSAEATTSVKNKHEYDLFRTTPSEDLEKEDYLKSTKKHTELKNRYIPHDIKHPEAIEFDDR